MKNFIILLAILTVTFSAQAQLAGTYTIDANQPTKKANFNSLNDALNALRFQEIEADVVFELADAEYFQPLVVEGINSELGHNVHFTSKNEPVQFSNDGLSLLVFNSSNLTFSNLKFKAISTEMSSMVTVSNSKNIEIIENEFYAKEDDASFKNIVSLSNNSDNNLIEGNSFRGTGGITIERLSNDNYIVNNKMYFQNTGIEVLTALNTTIEGNTLKALNKEGSTGILVDGFVGEINIASNAILNVNEGIAQKVIYRPSNQKVSGEIVNNVIETVGNSVVLNNNVEGLKIAFNTMNSKNASVLVFDEEIKGSMSNISLFGNNFINDDEALILDISRDIYLASTDYNNLYNEGGVFAAKVGSLEAKSFEEYQSGMNAENSISADPMFIQNGDKEYLLSEMSPCIDAGPDALNIGVLADFDGDERGAITEIGADEFNRFALDEILNDIQLAQTK